MALAGMVVLDRAFINLASDLTQYVICGTAGSQGGGGARTDVKTLTGTFRQYANKVTRVLLGSSSSRVETLVLRALTPGQVSSIVAWAGQTVLFRDTYGRALWGTYLVVNSTDIPLSGHANSTLLTDVSIEIQEVTYVLGLT